MKKTCYLQLTASLLILTEEIIASNPDVQVMGTTVPPGFTRIQGKKREECPAEFPYSFNDGKSCCRFYCHLSNESIPLKYTSPSSECRLEDSVECLDQENFCRTRRQSLDLPTCSINCPLTNPWTFNNGTSCCRSGRLLSNPEADLQLTSPLEECAPDDVVQCPSPSSCYTNAEALVPEQCPESHPVATGNSHFCCASKFKNFDSLSNSLCNGAKMQASDPLACCPQGNFVSCQNGERKCFSIPGFIEKLLVAKQDIRDGVKRVFDSTNYLDYNRDNTSAELYSRLFQLEDFRGPDEKFHMKLCYPMLLDTDSPDHCIEFKQFSNPLSIEKTLQNVEGLEILQRLYDDLSIDFAGLRSDTRGYTYLDGDKTFGKWWNAIVTVKLKSLQQLIPAYNSLLVGPKYTELAELYVFV